MSVTLKWLIILVFLVVILFVPWGVFYYTGWAVGAAFMFLISLIYWVFASFFNAIAYVLVTAINAVASIIMGVIIWIVEFFMSLFMKPNYFNPKSQAYEFYWQPGHALFDNSLLKYSDIATVPILMVPIKPDWQPWMNQILIVKFFELVPGAQAIANAFGTIGDAMGKAFQDIIIHSPPWVVILIGLLPVILVISIVVWIYLKYRYAPEMTS
jgi:ABC-type multidrug transport system fused ATPase/permease subunit